VAKPDRQQCRARARGNPVPDHFAG